MHAIRYWGWNPRSWACWVNIPLIELRPQPISQDSEKVLIPTDSFVLFQVVRAKAVVGFGLQDSQILGFLLTEMAWRKHKGLAILLVCRRHPHSQQLDDAADHVIAGWLCAGASQVAEEEFTSDSDFKIIGQGWYKWQRISIWNFLRMSVERSIFFPLNIPIYCCFKYHAISGIKTRGDGSFKSCSTSINPSPCFAEVARGHWDLGTERGGII